MAIFFNYIPVINQNSAPAIWVSTNGEFPADFLKGRLLISTDDGGIYLDDTNSSRVCIQSPNHGNIAYQNGVLFNTTGQFSSEISGDTFEQAGLFPATPNTVVVLTLLNGQQVQVNAKI